MNVLVTGANGFIGKNLMRNTDWVGVTDLIGADKLIYQDLPDLIKKSNFIIHLAGENRPKMKKILILLMFS